MPRLEEPRRRHAPAELAHPIVVEHVHERRHRQALVLRLDTHRQLVAKMAHRRFAHAGHAQVLAQRRGLFEIEIVERNDAIDGDLARQMRRAEDEVVHLPALLVVLDVEDVVQAVARPLGIAQAGGGDEQHAAALALGLAQELEPFVIRRQTQDGQWHADPSGPTERRRGSSRPRRVAPPAARDHHIITGVRMCT